MHDCHVCIYCCLFVCIACLCITSPLYCNIDHVTDGIMRFGVCLMVASWYSEHYMMTILAHREQNKLHGSCITVLIYIVYSSFKSNHNWSIRRQFSSPIAILVRLQVVIIIPVHLWTSGLCGYNMTRYVKRDAYPAVSRFRVITMNVMPDGCIVFAPQTLMQLLA